MQNMPTPTEMAKAAGISVPYASQILSGQRCPSRGLAISIFRATGRKFGPIEALSDADIDTLERIETASQSASSEDAA